MLVHEIATIKNDYITKFGVPYQSNVVKDIPGMIIFDESYRNPDMLRGLEDFSHIWLIWGFSENDRGKWSPTVRPPRLGGNTRMGVLATRSPFRPNPLGLSSVEVRGIERHPVYGPVIHVLGADLMNGTPIYDIKPYISFADSHPEARGGFAQEPSPRHLEVVADDKWLTCLPESGRQVVRDILACDPRPPYHHDPNRIYGLEYGEFEIKFKVDGSTLTVTEIFKR